MANDWTENNNESFSYSDVDVLQLDSLRIHYDQNNINYIVYVTTLWPKTALSHYDAPWGVNETLNMSEN